MSENESRHNVNLSVGLPSFCELSDDMRRGDVIEALSALHYARGIVRPSYNSICKHATSWWPPCRGGGEDRPPRFADGTMLAPRQCA